MKDKSNFRNSGKHFNIGDKTDGGIGFLTPIYEAMLCVTKKGIYSLRLADSTDPKKESPLLPDTKQKIVSYGSDDPVVGRVFLQANVLFEKGSLPLGREFKYEELLNISFQLLKDLLPLRESFEQYLSIEAEINSKFTGKLDVDGSLIIPIFDNLERNVKQYIQNLDHSLKHFMNISNLFYTDVAGKKWAIKLKENLLKQNDLKSSTINFLEVLEKHVWLIRNLRNAIEHPKNNDKVVILNYMLNTNGKIEVPSIYYDHKDIPLEKIEIANFMKMTFDNTLDIFELLLAYLCDVNCTSFADMKRFVAEVPVIERREFRENIKYQYSINWTK